MQLVLLALKMLEEATDTAETAVALDDEFLVLVVEFVPRQVQRNFGLAREASELGKQRPVLWFCPGLDRAFVQGLALVGDDEVEIDVDGVAETLATWAGAIRIIEKRSRSGASPSPIPVRGAVSKMTSPDSR